MSLSEAAPGMGAAAPGAGAESILEAARCPRCGAAIDLTAAAIVCPGCARSYPRLGQIPILLADPPAYLASCHRQLARLRQQAAALVADIREQLRQPDLLPLTRGRCLAMIGAIERQLADVRTLLEPLLPPAEVRTAGTPELVPATVEFLHYLYRDWGWPAEPGGENETALAAVEEALQGRPIGRTLVLGAGACRLAYDLYRRHPEAEVVVIDRDPLLFAAAHAVTHGRPLSICEANLEIADPEQSSREWVLRAREGPVDDARFHFLLADAVEPPFAPGSVDTVVTPWFIDQGPSDVRDFVSTLHRLLTPGGRWVNLGPLLYDLDVPIALRLGRDELFDLAERSGFRVGPWQAATVPYLVSKLNGRGRMQWVLSFAATRLDRPADRGVDDGPPDWLILRHLPVPRFPGQALAGAGVPGAGMVVSAIDGERSLDDIAHLIARQTRQPDVTLDEIRAAVRRCLAEIHPECRTVPA